MAEVFRFPLTIVSVSEGFERRHLGGAAENAKFENISTGWYIITDLGIVLPCGQGKPEFANGDKCRLTLEKL
jgi:hypothetical protein